jgi:hypothetical protein
VRNRALFKRCPDGDSRESITPQDTKHLGDGFLLLGYELEPLLTQDNIEVPIVEGEVLSVGELPLDGESRRHVACRFDQHVFVDV